MFNVGRGKKIITSGKAQIVLSTSSLPAASANGTTIGTLSAYKTTGTPTWSLSNNNGNRFKVTGSTLQASTVASAKADNPSKVTVHVTGVTPALSDQQFTILIV